MMTQMISTTDTCIVAGLPFLLIMEPLALYRGIFVMATKGLGGWRHLAGLAVRLHASFVVYKRPSFLACL